MRNYLRSIHWSLKVIGEMNDYQFKLVKIDGDFVGHDHQDTDEVFIVLEGEMFIDFRDGQVKISQGEMLLYQGCRTQNFR
ncbi:mannose-6-phosphate isomerase-like protein (cupin superfamily) [Paenibacillus polymyxa]|nr:mannose-6-phosphate isomerase-like protein (cupin superfamily) [Paenibacillus polymyxa]